MYKNRITIFGSYNKNSIGDKIILISLLDLIFRSYKSKLTVDIITFETESIQEEILKYRWKKFVRLIPLNSYNLQSSKQKTKSSFFQKAPKILQILISAYIFNKSIKNTPIKDSDALIIGGGNLLMDMYASWPIRPFTLQKKFIFNKKPTYLLGVGAFPIQTKINSYLLKSITRKANLVFVRDLETQKFIKKDWNIQNQSHPDLAFSYPIKTKISRKKAKAYKQIAINVAPIFGKDWPYKNPIKYQQFIKNFALQLFQYYTKNKNVKYFFYDTNYPTDCEASLAIIESLVKLGYPQNFIHYDQKLHTITELIKKIENCDIAITTRLHAAILALKINIPTLAISYQPKVKSVLANINLSQDAIIDIEKIGEITKYLDLIDKKETNYTLSPQQLKILDTTNLQIVKRIMGDIYKD